MTSAPSISSRSLAALLGLVLALVAAPAAAQDGTTTPDAQVIAQTPPPPVMSVVPAATTEQNCANHEDDDHDGLADCADADCFDSGNCEAGGSDENTEEACRDWLDNDGDGFTDCDDWDCSWNPEVVGNNVCPGPRVCAGRPPGQGFGVTR